MSAFVVGIKLFKDSSELKRKNLSKEEEENLSLAYIKKLHEEERASRGKNTGKGTTTDALGKATKKRK